jgi:hypothetical protein
MEKLVDIRDKFIRGEAVEIPDLNRVAAEIFPDPDCPERKEWSRHSDALMFTWELQKDGKEFEWPEV